MIVRIIGKTDIVLSLNEVGIQIQGKQTANSVDLDTEAKIAEAKHLEKSGLIQIIEVDEVEPEPENSPEPKSEQDRVKEAEELTQQSESRVIVSTGNETIETKMTKNAEGEIPESEATKASLEAMAKLEEEENEEGEEDEDAPPVKEEDLPPEEQMGREAVVMDQGSDKKVDMVNTAVPNSDKDRDPFIDREEKAEITAAEKASEDKSEDSKSEDESTESKELGEEAKKTEDKSEDSKSEDESTESKELGEEAKKTEDKSEDRVDDIFAPDTDDTPDAGGDDSEADDAFIEW